MESLVRNGLGSPSIGCSALFRTQAPKCGAADAALRGSRSSIQIWSTPGPEANGSTIFISLAFFFMRPLYLHLFSHLEFLYDLDHSLTGWPARESRHVVEANPGP